MKKKITLLLLEITAIIVLVCFLAFLGIDRYNRIFNDCPVYVVEFPDVDGLGVGCPVRFAGLHIGHVIKEKIKNDKILVTFKITRKNLKIPQGSTAGIESTGLVGSKSLEIRPPEIAAPKGQLIYPKDPLRISSIIGIQNKFGQVVLEVSDNVAHFLAKYKRSANESMKKAEKSFKETSAAVTETGKKAEETSKAVVQKTKDLKKVAETANETITGVNEALSSVVSGKDVEQSVNKVKESTEKLSKLVEKEKVEKSITVLNENLNDFNKNVGNMNTQLNKIKERETGYIKQFSDSMKSTADGLGKFADSLEKKDAAKPAPPSDK
jgi:ABC-type transporter Mla subunit MlaD